MGEASGVMTHRCALLSFMRQGQSGATQILKRSDAGLKRLLRGQIVEGSGPPQKADPISGKRTRELRINLLRMVRSGEGKN
jgi:hypothetical protein